MSHPSGISSQTLDSAPAETQERPPYRQQQQASIKQQLVNVYVRFFYLPFSSYGNRLDLVDVTLCPEKPPNKRGASLWQFMGISITQPIGVTIFSVLDSIRDKCSFSAAW